MPQAEHQLHPSFATLVLRALQTILRLSLYTGLVMSGCATSSPIQRYSESTSAFDEPPALMSHNYPEKDIHRIYHRASTGFVSIQSIRRAAEQRAEAFAQRQGKAIVGSVKKSPSLRTF